MVRFVSSLVAYDRCGPLVLRQPDLPFGHNVSDTSSTGMISFSFKAVVDNSCRSILVGRKPLARATAARIMAAVVDTSFVEDLDPDPDPPIG
jgi:hypothetical protein